MKYFQGYFQKIKNFSLVSSLVSSTVVTTDGQRKEPRELYLKSSAIYVANHNNYLHLKGCAPC